MNRAMCLPTGRAVIVSPITCLARHAAHIKRAASRRDSTILLSRLAGFFGSVTQTISEQSPSRR
jgi:hypothetical protein